VSGRKTFQTLKPIITTIGLPFSYMPRQFFIVTWPLFEHFPWSFGVLLRYIWAKRLAKSCGDNVLLETGVRITHWDQIEFGENSAIFENCYLDGKGGIKIGDNVSIAHHVSLISFDFDIDETDFNTPLKYSSHRLKPIVIGDDTLVFSGSRILAGAHLAPRTIIAANSVVKEGDYEPGVYAGAPAKFKRNLQAQQDKKS
jgi:acetyltransferase-like isoleucine patch superfamily enzyme